VGAFVSAAYAQKSPAPGTHITVSKAGGADYSAIQAAVNAARPGQVIEILDEAEYEEQVTIDGRETSPWAGVEGGKNGITIRYVPSSAGVTGRPVIKYQDVTNRSPKNANEARVPGDLLDQDNNFSTCAALRVLYATGIKIEGIIIDGGGAAPFGWENIWGSGTPQATPLVHGNAAVSLFASGNTQIRDCQLRNAYIGMYVKDVNSGGAFAGLIFADNDFNIPFSSFGKTGNHLFEYNKINDNSLGIMFECSWDLGSTVRYNLIYNNYHKDGISLPAAGDVSFKPAGALFFKDSHLSPVAVYNNTFYKNNLYIVGGWQAGYQDLIFNNIFSKPYAYGASAGSYASYMDIVGKYPNRMKHNVFAADGSPVSVAIQNGCTVVNTLSFRGFASPSQTNVATCGQSIQPGAVIPRTVVGAGVVFPENSNNRWLETAGAGSGAASLPNLFKSVDPEDPEFLAPDWDNDLVDEFIRNGGWPDGGITDAQGTDVADQGVRRRGGDERGPVYHNDSHAARFFGGKGERGRSKV
jgi:hypothetical protein